MHGIVKPIDQVFSTQSAEWHGLADVVERIERHTVAPLMFPIVTGPVCAEIDGVTIPLDNHKILLADYRFRKETLAGTDFEHGLVPLHIPKKSYRPITNQELWDAMAKALVDVQAEVSCVGTLEAGKKFFISAKLNDGGEFSVNGDKFLAHMNFITSHDGTLGVRAYDSTVRIVCMNTLRWSLNAQGDVGFNVYHTQGADVAMANLGDLVNEVLSGRARFRDEMQRLAEIGCTNEEAHLTALGYFVAGTGNAKLSTRSFNAADEILALFARGTGNNGRTLYDLLNGVTEYFTKGNGTGKTASASVKAYKANFGEAAEHKNAFANYLLGDSDTLRGLQEMGRKAIAEKAIADNAAQ